MSSKPKPWKENTWYIVDTRDHVRACIGRCLRREARGAGDLMFAEPAGTMRAFKRTELSVPQRMESIHFAKLTPAKCAALLGCIAFPVDHAARAEHSQQHRGASAGGGQ